MKHHWNYEPPARKVNKHIEAAKSVALASLIGIGMAALLFFHLSN